MQLSSYQEDTSKQESGSHCYIGEGYFLVRRFGTDESNKQLESIKRGLYGFAPKEIDSSLVLASWLCDYGITGWGGILDEEENELEFSVMNLRRVILNPSCYLSLNTLLINHASNYTSYLFDEVVEDVENIKKS